MGMSNLSGPLFVGGGITGGALGPAGQVFYVNVNTAGEARNQERPWFDQDERRVFATHQGAIDACVADRGDVIYVARGDAKPSATVNFNKQGITMIAQEFGLSPLMGAARNMIDSSNTDGPAARITKACHLIGIGFSGAQASGDTRNATVQIDASASSQDARGTWLDHCYFTNGERASVNYGVIDQGGTRTLINNCSFYGGAATNILDAGILHDESSTGGGGRPGEIDCYKNRYFHCEYAHEVVSGSRVVNSIWDSEMMGFQAVGDVWVKFLKLNVLGGGGAVHGAHVMNCNFSTAVDTGTFSHTLAQLITEGYQFSGNSYGSDLTRLVEHS